MKQADLVGMTFDWLTVESKIGVKQIGKTKRVLWKCKCVCGNYTEANTNALTQHKKKSCGCKKHHSGESRKATKIGDVYGYLTVIEEVGKNNEGRILYRCSCSRCGGETITTGKNLRSGWTQSCGCIKQDCMSKFGETNFRDLTGQQIGYLLVESRAPTKHSAAGNQTTMWNCKCLLCGSKTIVAANSLLTENHTRSCGCLKMSFAEYDIKTELDTLNIRYEFDYSFPDLISPNSYMPLRFDFAFFDDNNHLLGLLEYQGHQHFKKYAGGFGDFQREITDPMKKEYCEKHSIPLYEIRYDDFVILNLHNILESIYHKVI